MKYSYSIQDAISQIVRSHPKNKPIQARIGMRTNGDLHLGNIFPIVTAILVGNKLIANGYGYNLIVVLVDQEIKDDELPFNCTNYSEGQTLADYSINNIKGFVSDLAVDNKNFNIEYKLVSESQRSDGFRSLLIKIVENYNEKLRIYSICKNCNALLKEFTRDDLKLLYRCRQCHEEKMVSLDGSIGDLMFEHDLLGAIENNLFNIDLHILGSDHAIVTGDVSSLERRAIFQNIIDSGKNYPTLLTPLLTFKGEKMSKSLGAGIFLKDVRAIFGDEYVCKLVDFVERNNQKTQVDITGIDCV